MTGHSLGGTLTGPLFAALHAALGAGGSRGPQMDLMSFAGLTPGNQAFAEHLDRITPRMGWRVVNPLDAAPHFFAGLNSVLQIYDAEGLPCPQRHAALIKKVFDAAATRYVQPGGEPTLLPRVFEKPKPLWITEAVRQHRFPTYLALVERETQTKKAPDRSPRL